MRIHHYLLLAVFLGVMPVGQALAQSKDSIRVGTIHVSKYGTGPADDDLSGDRSSKAMFPGGDWAMRKFIRRTRHSFWAERFKSHSDYVQLYVDVDTLGKLSNPKLVHWPRDKYKDEALRIISAMPNWQPATNANGKRIPSTVTLNISFPGYRIWGKK